MKQNSFYTNYSFTSHFHLGYEYFKSIEEIKTFLNLYGNVEKLIYIISNRLGDKIRSTALHYAKSYYSILEEFSKDSINEEGLTVENYISLLDDKQEDGYYGINMKKKIFLIKIKQ